MKIEFLLYNARLYFDGLKYVFTVEGRLLLCLGNEHSVDLRAVLRAHPGEIEPLTQAIIDAMVLKPERHYFDLDNEPQIVRFMNTTGG